MPATDPQQSNASADELTLPSRAQSNSMLDTLTRMITSSGIDRDSLITFLQILLDVMKGESTATPSTPAGATAQPVSTTSSPASSEGLQMPQYMPAYGQYRAFIDGQWRDLVEGSGGSHVLWKENSLSDENSWYIDPTTKQWKKYTRDQDMTGVISPNNYDEETRRQFGQVYIARPNSPEQGQQWAQDPYHLYQYTYQNGQFVPFQYNETAQWKAHTDHPEWVGVRRTRTGQIIRDANGNPTYREGYGEGSAWEQVRLHGWRR